MQRFRSIALILVLLVISKVISAQAVEIEVRLDSLYINSKKVTHQTAIRDLESILGKPDRKFYLANIIWTYDNLGLRIYIGKEDSSDITIALDFKKDNFEFSPKKEFQGVFVINNQKITKKTLIADFEKMGIGFKLSNFDMYNASTGNIRFIFDYFNDRKELEVIEISFKKPAKFMK